MSFSSDQDNIFHSRSYLWIFLWTMAISGSAWLGWLYYIHLRESRQQDSQYKIVAIVQSHREGEGLKTGYLAELLKLSVDVPTNLYQFDVTEGEKRLLSSPVIKESKIQKIRPGTLFVQYQMRTPIGYLGDYTNTAFDSEGILFPFTPFFTPKKIPTIILGIDQMDMGWGSSLKNDEKLQMALLVMKHVQHLIKNQPYFLNMIDVSKAFSDSEGQRQIVISLEGSRGIEQDGIASIKVISYLLRLNPDHYEKGINNFMTLRDHMESKKLYEDQPQLIVDLRLEHLAFIK